MTIQPYLFFEGRAEEAAAFYQKVLGAEVQALLRFKDSPDPCPEGMIPPGAENKVMHMSMKIGDSVVMASDGRCSGAPSFQGVSLCYAAKDAADADRAFEALSDGGAVQMPMGKTFFSPRFGMTADRFGVSWMVIVPA
ncbi:VOC family protein [Methylocapsa aurea]|uniref:VOC family protein n=1 Tax=Methylocapsa aurea TaxID=663610 RepID=UPI000567AF19|nr:VOC family protein [Methylocapsa aurea]